MHVKRVLILSLSSRFNYSSCGASIYLTEAFADALFSEKMTYHGEMDFRAYIDFVLAMENKSEEQAISYFVKVLDIHGKGYLNSGDLHYFYKVRREICNCQFFKKL